MLRKVCSKFHIVLSALKDTWAVALGVLLDVASLGHLASCLESRLCFFLADAILFLGPLKRVLSRLHTDGCAQLCVCTKGARVILQDCLADSRLCCYQGSIFLLGENRPYHRMKTFGSILCFLTPAPFKQLRLGQSTVQGQGRLCNMPCQVVFVRSLRLTFGFCHSVLTPACGSWVGSLLVDVA